MQLLRELVVLVIAGDVERRLSLQWATRVNEAYQTLKAPLSRALGGAGIGTLFLPVQKARARKAWLGGRMKLKGALVVDMGAAKALQGGSSLLAAGVTSVTGTFARGDPVGIVDADGTVLAHGLSEYDSVECDRLKGRQSSEHEALLGYAPRSAVVHRNQLVLK